MTEQAGRQHLTDVDPERAGRKREAERGRLSEMGDRVLLTKGG